jgi:hypothetical protein
MLTQQRALTRSASASRSWHRARPCARTLSSRLSGFASQAPISAIVMPAASAASAYASASSSEASSGSGQYAVRKPRDCRSSI